MMEIKPLLIKKIYSKERDTSDVDLQDAQNLEQIKKYVLPIIAQNEGWGTPDLTIEKFDENPQQFQTAIDTTLGTDAQILIDNGQPVALLEYETITTQEKDDEAMKILSELLSDFNNQYWDFLKKAGLYDQLQKFSLQDMTAFLANKKIYRYFGIVVKPSLQSIGKEYTQKLLNLMSDGIVLGYTSNPILVRKMRTVFSHTVYFPIFDEVISSASDAAAILLAASDLFSDYKKNWQPYEFGALQSEYFIAHRDESYIAIAEKLHSLGKITDLDLKRIKYVLKHIGVYNAIVSYN